MRAGAVVLLGGTVLMIGSGVTVTNEAGVRVGVVPPSVALATLAVVLVVGMAAASSLREQRSRLAAGCLWAGAGGLLPVWALAPLVPPPLGAAALAATPLTVAGAALVGTGWAQAPHRLRLVHGLVAAAVSVHLVGYDPFRDPSCGVTCDQVDVPAAGLLPTATLLAVVAGLTWAAALAAVASLWRARASTPTPAMVAALLALLLVALVVTEPWVAPGSLEQALVPGLVAAAAPSMGVLAVWGRTYRTRRALRDLVLRLGDPRASLEALPDLVVGVHVATPEGDWVDVAGQRMADAPPDGTVAVPLGPDMRLLTRAGPAGTADVVGRLSAADLVALSHARLGALTRAHHRDVRESQRRIVALSDQERLRIERDLHDGAQQRLVAAKLHLRLAESAVPPAAAARLAASEQQVQVAIERLRSLAHGVFPRLLEAEGLSAALHDLARQTPVPLTLDLQALRPAEHALPLDVSTALYAMVVASVQDMATSGGEGGGPAAGAGEHPPAATVRAGTRPGWLTLQVDAPAHAAAPQATTWQDAADRVGAVGGRLTLHEAPTGWSLAVEVPCESS